jgi:hypothetical protein
MFTVTLLTTSNLTGLLLLFATLYHSQPSFHFAREALLPGASFTVAKTAMAWHSNTETNSAIHVQSYMAIANWKSLPSNYSP